MPRPSPKPPSYRLHKPSGQAVVTLRTPAGRRDVYLGPYGSAESRAEYARLIAERAAGPAAPPAGAADLSLNEVLVGFLGWAGTHYRTPDGGPTTEVNELKRSIAVLRELYGHTPAAAFGPKALAAVRQKMIALGWCRSLINRRVDRIKRVFKWATAEELVPVAVYQALRTLAGLQRGRTPARESEPVRPVDPAHVEAVLPFVRPPVRAMIRLQGLTGMRPGEVCGLVWAAVDRSAAAWVYRPARHKTAHRGKARVVPIGPKARAVVVGFLTGGHPPPAGFEGIDLGDPVARRVPADAYAGAGRERDAELLRDVGRPVAFVAGCVVDPAAAVFDPAADREERFREWRAARRSKVPPSQRRRRKKVLLRRPGRAYNPHAYANAIRVACEKHKVPHWHPNQLRHTFATAVRERYGLEAAQVLLGHERADVTQVYAERNLGLALKVAAEIG